MTNASETEIVVELGEATCRLEITYEWEAGTPAVLDRAPEDCYPAEYEYFCLTEVRLYIAAVDYFAPLPSYFLTPELEELILTALKSEARREGSI